jgi:superfamily II DNA or RNA helicase
MARRRTSGRRRTRRAQDGGGGTLAKRCRGEFLVGDRDRGESYLYAGRVKLSAADEGGVGALVTGSDPEPYLVLVDWSEAAASGAVKAHCDCPRFAGGFLCKHLWATLVAVDRAGLHRYVPGDDPLVVDWSPELDEDGALPGGWDYEEAELEDEEDEDDEDDEEDPEDAEELERKVARWLSGFPPAAPPGVGEGTEVPAGSFGPGGAAGTWRQRLAAIAQGLQHGRRTEAATSSQPLPRRQELWLQVDLGATRSCGQLTLDLHQREARAAGGMGVIKALALDEAKAAGFTDAADRDAAQLLLALGAAPPSWGTYSYYGASYRRPAVRTARVPAPLYASVLPRLAAGGRLVRGERPGQRPDPERRLDWDGGLPWRPALRLEAAEDGAARLTGALAREDEVLPLSAPLLLLADGLVIFADHLAPLEAGSAFAWIAELRRTGPMEIPGGQLADAFRRLGELPVLPELWVDDEIPVARVETKPRPVLVVEGAAEPPRRGAAGEAGRLRAELFFRYGERRVAGGEARSVLIDVPRSAGAGEPAVRLLSRDAEAEAAARRRLLELGAEPGPAGRALFLPAGRFAGLVDELLGDGWEVEARGTRLRRSGAFHLSVASGLDWFDLAGGIDFEGEHVALPRLLEAARRGEQYVALDDGSRGLLPAAWFERFGPLAGLGEETGGTVLRFLPSQALLLDAVLAAAPAELGAEVQVDEGFARLRDRLARGHELTPIGEPEGFRGELRRYQQEGLGWLSFLAEVGLGGCLADDMGLGKTIQVLALLLARRQREADDGASPRPTLVVAPRSLVYNWLDEAARFAPSLACLDYTGTRRKALRERFAEHDLVVTTYGTLRRDAAALAPVRFDYAILDEAQAIKNTDSQTAKAARLLHADHRLALSGTPIENHLSELGSLFEFLNPGMLGRSSRFRELAGLRRVESAESQAAVADLARALGPFILRRTKAEVLPELPAKTEQTLVVTLPKRQRELYDELRDHYRLRLTRKIEEAGLARSKMHVLEALLRLRQAACHPGLLDPAREEEGSAKLEALGEQLAEVLDEGHKALVFSQFTSFLGLVRRRLDRDGLRYEYLDGKTRDRAARVDRFQSDPDCRLFLISLKAGGTGLNLTAADYVFLLDPWWNPAVEAQAIDRTHRIGQQRPVFAYRLIARDTVEEKILQLQQTKRDLAEAILSASGGGLAKLSLEDLELLLS